MARVIVGSYMVRYPLGGMMSYVLQYLRGFQQLGHDVYFVEKAGYPDACYDPALNVMSDDCSYGAQAVATLLGRFGLQDRWCFVDVHDRYVGLSRDRIEDVFRTADLFLDMGTHGAWMSTPTQAIRVLLDGEPGFTQMKMENRLARCEDIPAYDLYYTVGSGIGREGSSAPTAGRVWGHLWHPVVTDGIGSDPAPSDGPFTTVMNWQSHAPLEFGGKTYGQKDVEFERFFDLPRQTTVPLEVSVAGKTAPRERLLASGWRVRDAHAVTASYDSFRDYLLQSRGEFSVCKNVFVSTGSGWFSDRSAAYLAAGRPVVIQDTGFSSRLPTGRGLFAVRSVEEAAAAIDDICGDYAKHATWAREVACEHFEATRILERFLDEIGIGPVVGHPSSAGQAVIPG